MLNTSGRAPVIMACVAGLEPVPRSRRHRVLVSNVRKKIEKIKNSKKKLQMECLMLLF